MSLSSRDMMVLCGGIEHLVGSNAPCYGIQRGELEVIGVSSRTEYKVQSSIQGGWDTT